MKDKYVFLISFILVLLDQVSKIFFTNKFVGEALISISYSQNSGSAFSLFSGVSFYNIIIVLFSLVALYVLYKEHTFFSKNHIELIPLLMVSGIIGNLIDRVGFGYVRDFIALDGFFVFNFADSYLFLGVTLFLIYEMKKYFSEIRAKK